MGTVIASTATALKVSGVNRFTEPRPATVGMFLGTRMDVAFAAAGTSAYAVGTVNDLSSTAYFRLNVAANRIPATPGETIQYIIDTSGSGGRARTIRLYFYDSTGTIINSIDSAPESSGSWATQTVSGVAPEGTVTAGAIVIIAASNIGDTLFVRRIYAGNPSPYYFDGGFSPDPRWNPEWLGAANASQSRLSAVLPVVEVYPEVVDGWEVAREVRSIVHTILNRSAPDVTLRQPGMRSGRFTMVFADEPAALTAYAGLSVPQTFIISDEDVPAVDMQFIVGDAGGGTDEMTMRLDDDTRSVWLVEVPFTEVGT